VKLNSAQDYTPKVTFQSEYAKQLGIPEG